MLVTRKHSGYDKRNQPNKGSPDVSVKHSSVNGRFRADRFVGQISVNSDAGIGIPLGLRERFAGRGLCAPAENMMLHILL